MNKPLLAFYKFLAFVSVILDAKQKQTNFASANINQWSC